MKKLMLGMLIGMMSATAVCTCNNKNLRRAKRVLVNKIDDILT